jgi:hypothetical protein
MQVPSFPYAVDCYNIKEFRSPTRSTIPLLSLLKSPNAALGELLSATGMTSSPAIHLEYTVPPPAGKGIPSHTDAMLLDGDSALAIEAKWSEPRYATVSEWLQKGGDSLNRQTVLQGWLSCLQNFSQEPLTLNNTSEVVYQMVHRAASACATVRKSKLLYLCFTPQPNGRESKVQHILDDMTTLHALLGSPLNFQFYLAAMEASPTEAFQSIAGLPKGTTSTADRVSVALKGEPLFDFSLRQLHTITGACK